MAAKPGRAACAVLVLGAPSPMVGLAVAFVIPKPVAFWGVSASARPPPTAGAMAGSVFMGSPMPNPGPFVTSVIGRAASAAAVAWGLAPGGMMPGNPSFFLLSMISMVAAFQTAAQFAHQKPDQQTPQERVSSMLGWLGWLCRCTGTSAPPAPYSYGQSGARSIPSHPGS